MEKMAKKQKTDEKSRIRNQNKNTKIKNKKKWIEKIWPKRLRKIANNREEKNSKH